MTKHTQLYPLFFQYKGHDLPNVMLYLFRLETSNWDHKLIKKVFTDVTVRQSRGLFFFHRLQFSWISFCSWMSCLRLAIRGKKCRFKTICIIFSFQTWKLCTSFLYSLWEKIKQTVTLFICECFGEGLLSSDMWRLIWLALLIAKTF